MVKRGEKLSMLLNSTTLTTSQGLNFFTVESGDCVENFCCNAIFQ